MVARIADWLMWSGTGNCTRMPWIAGSSFSCRTRSSTSTSVAVAGSLWVTETIPAASVASPLLRT